ncbi:MAG: peptidoglycan recognition family protein [Pyrinomonadaceae bacterium]
MSKRTAAETTRLYTGIVEQYAHFFDRPEVRLRFLNNTLRRQATSNERLLPLIKRYPALEETRFYYWLLDLRFHALIIEELKKLLPNASKKRRRLWWPTNAPYSARLFFHLYEWRKAYYGLSAMLAVAAVFGFFSVAVWSAQRTRTYLAQRNQTPQVKQANANSNAHDPAYATTPDKYLPDYKPEKVWLVERKDNYERYSNGGRIITDYETDNHERGYLIRRRGADSADETIHKEPAGILYHTSESDLDAFTADNSSTIERRTQDLLEHVKRGKLYNYVIDRFGQIYRIVRDDQAANHAGHSIWGDAQNIYIGLNESFLGVCFETQTEAGADERLTEAQLISGRTLTAVLRSRYQIDDTDCVTHGLVSVNPGNMIISYHHDWVRGFPFEAMGLSDKYKIAPASVSEFGFTADQEDRRWPGVAVAEAEFKQRADAAHLKPEEMRRRERERYFQQMDQERRLRIASAAGTDESESDTSESLARRQADSSGNPK